MLSGKGIPMTKSTTGATVLQPGCLDRAVGALLGLAAGDALGAGYEFQSDPPAYPEIIGGGPFNFAPGEWTDDTQMAICIAREGAIGHLDPGAVGDRFLAWFREGQKDVGNQTRCVLGGADDGADLATVAEAYLAGHPHCSAGNGSLMRTAPVALAYLGNDNAIAEAARAISGLTHADPLAGDACVLWCIAIDRAIREARLDGVRDGLDLLDTAARDRWADLLDDAETKPARSFQPNGYVVTALQAAHAAVTQSPVPTDQPCRHLQNGLRAAVHVGDDNDTVAAIAGALLGARWGASAIPLEWRSQLHGWPGYNAGDLKRLAVLVARRGLPDTAGWPSAPSLIPYYHAAFPGQQPIDEALHDDEGVRVGNVAGLGRLATGPAPDVVVSLCRVGADDVPSTSEGHELFLFDDAKDGANPNLDFVVKDTATAIIKWRNAGKTVFVHCVAGESRTPTIAAAYLAQRFGLSGADALDHVRKVLPVVRPNSAFLAALDRLWPSER
jgi:ADP-ribosylglycohydrolase